MKKIKNHEDQGVYCPWNDRIGICYKCMALIQPVKAIDNFVCGRLYPPEHFKEL